MPSSSDCESVQIQSAHANWESTREGRKGIEKRGTKELLRNQDSRIPKWAPHRSHRISKVHPALPK